MLAEEGAAIEAVFARFHAGLERRLTALTRNSDDGSELAAEAFARLSRETAEGRMPRDPDAWLNRVGANLAWSRGRHLVVAKRHLAAMPILPAAAEPDAVVIFGETCQELGLALEELGTSEREAVCLAARGYRAEEIGSEMGRTAGAVRALLFRARSKLRDRLQTAGHVLGAWCIVLAGDDTLVNLLA